MKQYKLITTPKVLRKIINELIKNYNANELMVVLKKLPVQY